ncbi:LytR/AlgR family response regulator transcription factor [Tenacibaculum jejuense]|uniref:Two component transcriptional regulator, LytTR family n=1 Tax=Tenacibaculum jejuense TaxID=584609 RepID=A0A238UEV9_9FLAO|nr:LytTR family DNA-binding domain-containing protein [Tenacibaculum jejuense]SNR17743.1 Two component transcriptional regulator, LytTR family [Tenacibaculum jejuense]
MITCIIIEDELPAQKVLKSFLNKTLNIELLASFQTAKEAHRFLQTNTVDFVFLDINLPDIMGIDFMKTLINPPFIIITTAYPDYALDSFDLETIVDYLVKPFSFDRFLKAIRKIEQRVKQIETEPNDCIFLNIDKTLHKVLLHEILYVESDRNYLTFITHEKKYVFIDSLKNWITKLPQHFVQIHKSYIVNLNHIDKIAGNEIHIGKICIPVGRTFKSNFMMKFNAEN